MDIPRAFLRDALALTAKAVGSNNTLPILACVDLQADGRNLTLTTNNLETVIRTCIPMPAQETFSTAVPAQVLADIVSSSDAETIHLDFDKTAQIIKVNSGGGKSKIKALSHDEFPLLPDVETLLGKLPAHTLKSAIKRVVIAASSDLARPALNGVQLAKLGQDVYLAAADGFRLAAYRLESPLEFPEKRHSLVIPRQAAIKLTQILPDDDEMVSIFLSKNASAILFSWQTTYVWVVLLDAAFPDWQQIVPSGFKHTLNLPGKEAIAALHRAEIFAREANHVIRFKPGAEGGLVIEGASDETGKSETMLDVVMPFQIAFNGVFAKQGIEAIGADAVHLHLNLGNTPAMLTNGSDRYIYILMPMVDTSIIAAPVSAAHQAEQA